MASAIEHERSLCPRIVRSARRVANDVRTESLHASPLARIAVPAASDLEGNPATDPVAELREWRTDRQLLQIHSRFRSGSPRLGIGADRLEAGSQAFRERAAQDGRSFPGRGPSPSSRSDGIADSSAQVTGRGGSDRTPVQNSFTEISPISHSLQKTVVCKSSLIR